MGSRIRGSLDWAVNSDTLTRSLNRRTAFVKLPIRKRASVRVPFLIALKSPAHYAILALEKQTYLYVNKYEYKYEYKIQTRFWERNYG